jgi:carboxyl-terminal processing protease
MTTLAGVFKRILSVGAGAVLGIALSVSALRVATAWNLWPNRDLSRNTSYLREVMRLVNENYVEENAAVYDQLARNALHGMLESLDPHSEFLEAKDNLEFEEDLTGEFGGVGLQVETRQNRIVVIASLAGTPSERAGVRRGDEIVTIDGKSVEGSSSIDNIAGRLRGKPKTRVQMGIFRPGTKETLNLTLVREIIRVESVRNVQMIDGDVGYIQLTEFSDHTAEQFERALDQLIGQGARSLVLDMRNNPGGLLDAAVAVAQPFFRQDELIVYTRGRKPEDREDFRANGDRPAITLPLAVLINAGSASAAEVVTGALKDTGRAIVVGERSFGKGSVQSVFRLENGEGMRLTTSRYYTPSGASIHQKGIAPHVEVVMTAEEDTRLAVQRSRSDLTDPKEFKERFGFEPVVDRQLDAAVAVLRGVRNFGEQTGAASLTAR